jgi:hypothetical protein
MSSLLEEAIVDAKALKEAALKNAEDVVLEKYSREVKSALNHLLEQDEMAMGDDMGMDMGGEMDMGAEAPPAPEPGDASFLEETPYAFQTEDLDAPPPDEIVEIDFDQLKARLEEDEAEGIESSPDELMGSEETALELQEAGIGFLDVDKPGEASLEGDPVSQAAEKESQSQSDEDIEKAAVEEALDDEIDISEEMIDSLVNELLNVDMNPELQGWSSLGSAYNSTEQANNDAMAAAVAAHLTEDGEELEEEARSVSTESDVDLYESRIKNLNVSVKELKSLLQEAKFQLRKMNLANAKLVYQNKALGSPSLNERQKNKIVEAVSRANSVEEAKVLYETIQNAVGVSNSMNRSRPQTLREAVSKHTSLLLSSQRESKATDDPRMDRMLRLAGLVD